MIKNSNDDEIDNDERKKIQRKIERNEEVIDLMY